MRAGVAGGVGATLYPYIYNVKNSDKSLLRIYSNRLVSHFCVYSTMCNNLSMTQKLSPKASAAKKKRDLAFAKTMSRKRKKAENQRKRRAALKAGKNIKGKDYDHKDGKFKSIKANRGNDGKGTKRESRK